MLIQSKSLVQFDAIYYKYPRSVSRGFWARHPIEEGLSANEQRERKKWLDRIQSQSSSAFHDVIIGHFVGATDQEELLSILSEHGVFAERFFHRNFRERIARQLAKSSIRLEEFQKLIDLAWGHEIHLRNKSDVIFHVTDYLFEQNLFCAIRNAQIYRKIQAWFEEFSEPITCVLCGNLFRVIDLPDWIYFGSNGFKHCCFRCQIVEAPRKSELNILVPAFAETCGFIPNSVASPINYAFTSQFPNSAWTKIILAYASMGGIEHVKKKFGAWFTALAETGALPDGVLSTARGIRCLAKDGHTCHSLDEQRIDDWLHSHHLDHEREPIYPQHPSLNSAGKRRADWKVKGIYVEYFGLVGDPEYENRMDEKILLAQEFNISLIAIFPSDIENLDERLGCLLH